MTLMAYINTYLNVRETFSIKYEISNLYTTNLNIISIKYEISSLYTTNLKYISSIILI